MQKTKQNIEKRIALIAVQNQTNANENFWERFRIFFDFSSPQIDQFFYQEWNLIFINWSSKTSFDWAICRHFTTNLSIKKKHQGDQGGGREQKRKRSGGNFPLKSIHLAAFAHFLEKNLVNLFIKNTFLFSCLFNTQTVGFRNLHIIGNETTVFVNIRFLIIYYVIYFETKKGFRNRFLRVPLSFTQISLVQHISSTSETHLFSPKNPWVPHQKSLSSTPPQFHT